MVDTNGRPIGDDHVAVQIAETLKEEEVPSGWMWSMHSWPIKRVFLNRASLHDHDQTDMYQKAVNAQNQRPRKGILSYKTTRERRNVDILGKKERALTTEAIHEVSTKSCCKRNCVQSFPRSEIEAIRSKLNMNGGVYNRKSVLLKVHRQVHKDSNGKEWITLKGREVCPSALQTIRAISRATYYRYKEMAMLGKQVEDHGNLGSKKPRKHTMQATATLRVMIEDDADRMPNKTRTLNLRERVPAMVLQSAFPWKDQLPKINEANVAMNLKPISASNLSRIQKESFLGYAPKGRGDSFARCGTCDEYKQLRSACTPMSVQREKWKKVLRSYSLK